MGPAAKDVRELAEAFNEMLERLETERRDSARRAVGAQEAERRRLARELHDELGQSLTGVLLQIDQAIRTPQAADLEEAREGARRSLEDVRRIARNLRPETLVELGLRERAQRAGDALHAPERRAASTAGSRPTCRRSARTWRSCSTASPRRR